MGPGGAGTPRGRGQDLQGGLTCTTVPGALARPRTRAVGNVVAAKRRCGAGNATEDFPRVLLEWTARDGQLLDALLALRRLGPEGHQAVEALLAVRRVAVLRLSWQLWAELVAADGRDPEQLLSEAAPLHVLEEARHALWGDRYEDEPFGDRPTRLLRLVRRQVDKAGS